MAKLSNSPFDRTVLLLEQRKSFSLGLWFKKDHENPVDLTGAVIRLTAARAPRLPGEIPELLIEKGAVISNPLLGYARVDLQAAELDLPPGNLNFVITLITVEGYSAVVVKGEIKVLANPDLDSMNEVFSAANPATSLQLLLQSHTIYVDVAHMVFAGPGVFTEAEKLKLAEIEPGAQVNVNADWAAESGDAKILNKPELGTAAEANLEELLPDDMQPFVAALFLLMHPVGSLYFSEQPTDPGTLFGGTWVRYAHGRVVVGVDENDAALDAAGKTEGAKTHLLTANESGLRSHNHTQNAHNHTQDAHTHTQNSHNHSQSSHNHSQSSHTHTQNSHSHTRPYKLQSGGAASTRSGEAIAGANSGDATASFYNAMPPTSSVTAVNQSTTATNSATTATNSATTATNVATTATNQSTTATNNAVAASDALEAHNIMQPSIACYIWKRTA